MPRSVWFAALLALVTACAPPARPAPTPTPAVSGAAPSAVATQEPVRVIQRGGGGQDVTMEQITVDPKTGKSRLLYDVRSLQSVGTNVNSNAMLDHPHITFHDRSGKTLVADAPKATITLRDKGVLMTGGVHARTQGGSLLTCDRLHYDGRTEKLEGDGHVVLTGSHGADSYQMTGDHIIGDVRLDNVRITKAQ
jgi:hypothetical protein